MQSKGPYPVSDLGSYLLAFIFVASVCLAYTDDSFGWAVAAILTVFAYHNERIQQRAYKILNIIYAKKEQK